LIFAVCDRFLNQLGGQFDSTGNGGDKERKGAAAAVAEWLKEHYGREDLTRERIYPLFWEAVRRNFLFLQAPREKRLAERLAARYDLSPAKDDAVIHVVNANAEDAARHVTSATADLVLDLVDRVIEQRKAEARPGEPPKSVHIGMGAGFATMMVAKRLAERVRTDLDCPPLVLHALSAGGFLVNEPQKAPITYFSYFEDTLPKVEYVGLFSETVVSLKEDYERVKKSPGVRRSFERRSEIDIIVTSLAAAHHEHGLLVKFLSHLIEEEVLKADVFDKMDAAGWMGDVQFRPYTESGPLIEECPVRAVTLFELDEMVEFARADGKYLVLLAGPCGECGAPKVEALRPLVANPHLRLWTHLVTDVQTAQALAALSDEE
jgi:hypothetical protein